MVRLVGTVHKHRLWKYCIKLQRVLVAKVKMREAIFIVKVGPVEPLGRCR